MSKKNRDDQLLIDTLNLLASVGDLSGFQSLTEKAGKSDVGPVKTARLFELAPVAHIDDLKKAKGVGPTIIRYMREGLIGNLKKAKVNVKKPLAIDVLQVAIMKLSGSKTPIETTASLFHPATLGSMPMLQLGPLLPPLEILTPMSFDEWYRLYTEVRERGEALLGVDTHRSWSNNARTGCALAVFCRTRVMLVRSLSDRRGSTEYIPEAEVDRGTWSGTEGNGGCFVTVTLNFLIRLDLSDVGERMREQNRTVRREREDAGRPFSFDHLPLEFMLIHEEQHRDDLCRDLTAIAQPLLSCDLTAEQQRAMQNALNTAWDNIRNGDLTVNGAIEESIRRRTWEEWDRRHP